MDSLIREEIARINAQPVKSSFEHMVEQDILRSKSQTAQEFWDIKLNQKLEN